MLDCVKFNKARMERGAAGGFTNATDAADYLVKKGLPFRQAHEVVGRLVLDCIRHDKALLDLTLDELKEYSPLFDADVYDAISLHTCVDMRSTVGGPSPDAVQAALDDANAWMSKYARD